MLNLEQAKEIVCSRLSEKENRTGEPLILIESAIIEKDFGWVFFYNSKKYIETGNSLYRLAGNAPFIVDKRDGSLHSTGTAEPIEYYISMYQKQVDSLK